MMTNNRLLSALLVALLVMGCGTGLCAQTLTGAWRGALRVGPMSVTLVLNLEQTDSGLTATLDSPDQNATGIPATATLDGDRLAVDIAVLNANFAARVDGDKLDGTFTQMGQRFPLTLTRQAGLDNDRPQEAAVAADNARPYVSEEVAFANGNITLKGTLTRPQTTGKHPAVVLVAGTGPNDRDETIMRHKPFLLLADHLSRNGVVVLRYDKRGVGGSSAGSADDTTEQLADDALAATRFLAAHDEVDTECVGMIGHSEGGQIAIMNAARHPDLVRFIVTLAAPALKGREVMIEQNRLIMRTMGIDATAEQMAQIAEVMTLVDTVADTQTLRGMLAQKAPRDQVDVLCSPAYRRLIQFDPSDDLRAVRCPMLAVNGTLDSQVACEQNLDAIARLVPQATILRYDGLNHLLQHCDGWKGSADYGQISQTMDPRVLEDIMRWIRQVAH